MIYEYIKSQDEPHPPVVQNNVMMVQHQVIHKLIPDKMKEENNWLHQICSHHLDKTDTIFISNTLYCNNLLDKV